MGDGYSLIGSPKHPSTYGTRRRIVLYEEDPAVCKEEDEDGANDTRPSAATTLFMLQRRFC